jgi:hypothetical protein
LKLIRDQGIGYGITLRDFIASFYLSRVPRSLLRLAAALLAAVLASGCRRTTPDGAPPTTSASLLGLRADLALVPAEARLIFSLDLDRLRASPLGSRLVAAPSLAIGNLLADLARSADIDLATQLRHLLVALPGERQDDDRLLAILRISPLDRTRASTWLRSRQTQSSAGFVAGPDRVVLARGAWAAQGASRKPSGELPDHAASDEELRRLCERAARQSAVWFAAIVPVSLRRRLIAEARFPDVASVARLHGSLGVDSGLHGELTAELSNRPDAELLAERTRAFVNAAKHHPDLLAQGLAPYLEAVRVAANGPYVQALLDLPAVETGDLAARLDELLRASLSGLGTSFKP